MLAKFLDVPMNEKSRLAQWGIDLDADKAAKYSAGDTTSDDCPSIPVIQPKSG